MKGASGLGAGMPQGFARVTIETLRRPIRVRETQPRHPELNARLIEIRHHAQLLRRCHAAKTFQLLGMDFIVHDAGIISSACGAV